MISAFVFNIIVSSCIIYYLNRLQQIGCKCALNFKHDYIFYFTCINLGIILTRALFGSLSIVKMLMIIISIPLVIAAILNIVYTIQYVNELKKNNCHCSESVYRELMFILALLNAAAYILFFLIFIPVILSYPEVFKKIVKNKQFMKKYIKNARPNNAL